MLKLLKTYQVATKFTANQLIKITPTKSQYWAVVGIEDYWFKSATEPRLSKRLSDAAPFARHRRRRANEKLRGRAFLK
jgi:hypothetical protein